MTMDTDDLRLDGNAEAGPLAELFGRDMTMTAAVCASCGAESPVGSLLAYDPGLGFVLRCVHCDAAVIRVARIRGGYCLDARGASLLRVPVAR